MDSSGGAIILDRSAPFLHFVDRSGRHATARIRQGAGPGELQQPVRIGSVGDSVWVFDASQGRASLFDRRGRFLASRTPPRVAVPGLIMADPIAFTRMGRTVFAGMVPDEALAAGPASIPIVAADASGSRLIANVPLTRTKLEIRVEVGGGQGRGFITEPFGDDPLWAVSQDGGTLVLVDRRAPSIRLGMTYDVTVLGNDGDTLSKFAVPYRAQLLTDQAFDRVIAELSTRRRLSGGHEMAIDEADLRARVFRPRIVPPISAADVGDDGTIWLRTTFPAFGDDPEYSVFDRGGKPLGQVAVPLRGRNRLLAASRHMLWFMTETPEGAPFIVSYLVR